MFYKISNKQNTLLNKMIGWSHSSMMGMDTDFIKGIYKRQVYISEDKLRLNQLRELYLMGFNVWNHDLEEFDQPTHWPWYERYLFYKRTHSKLGTHKI